MRGATIGHSADSAAVGRPTLRGVLHAVSFAISYFVGYSSRGRLIQARCGRLRGFSSIMLGTSALYHRVTWSPRRRPWMLRADHVAIFVLIAGTYTLVAVISLHGAWHTTVLAVVWSGALIAACTKIRVPAARPPATRLRRP